MVSPEGISDFGHSLSFGYGSAKEDTYKLKGDIRWRKQVRGHGNTKQVLLVTLQPRSSLNELVWSSPWEL